MGGAYLCIEPIGIAANHKLTEPEIRSIVTAVIDQLTTNSIEVDQYLSRAQTRWLSAKYKQRAVQGTSVSFYVQEPSINRLLLSRIAGMTNGISAIYLQTYVLGLDYY